MRPVTVALISLLVCLRVAPAWGAEQVSHFWRVVAAAEFIVIGTLNVPTEDVRVAIVAGSSRYIDAPLAIDTVLKGGTVPVSVVRHFTRDVSYNISNETLIAFNGRRAILFLVRVQDVLFFPYIDMGPEALQPAITSSISEIQTEIARQEAVSRGWTPRPDSPHRAEVQALIERMLVPGEQDAAAQELDRIAPDAVIAIIDAMDDRRRLAHSGTTLRTKSPNAFEALAHYGPEMVVDVCVGILNRAARASFFPSIIDGGSEQERQLAVSAWRVFGDMVLNHPNEIGPPAN